MILSGQGKWEDKSEEIALCVDNRAEKTVEISYKSNPAQSYRYRHNRVRLLDATRNLDPAKVQLRLGGRLLRDVESIVEYPGFYAVVSRGRRTLYAASEIGVERDVAADGDCKKVLDYFRAVAEQVSLKGDDGESLLAGQFRYVERVPDASVLAAYLNPASPLKSLRSPNVLIYPFGTNVSQKLAVEQAFRSQVLLVQGPPGTGKTQTILNLIANAVYFGQSVAMVSNNNTATKNVADKLEKKGLGFLLAPLGNRDNKQKFIANQPDYPNWTTWADQTPEPALQMQTRLGVLTVTLDKLIQADNDRAALVIRIAQTNTELEAHRKIEGAMPTFKLQGIAERLQPPVLLAWLIECEERGPNAKTGWLRTIGELLRYGFFGFKARRELFAAGPIVLRSLYYEKQLDILRDRLLGVERVLAENNFQSVQNQVQTLSWQLLQKAIVERFGKKQSRALFSERDLWSKYAEVLAEYPVVLSTTHSIKTSLSPDCLYDLIIIDEASQADTITGALALSCARRAVIVGDEKQLPNVITDENKQKASALWVKADLNCAAWNYAENSLLSSAKALWPQAPSVLLKEHYRCHPKIAGFFNQKFYDGQLIIMTTDRGEPDALQAVFAVAGNHARDRRNQRQADVIGEEVLPMLRQKGIQEIGVIAPYNDQVSLLKSLLDEAVQVGTVHGFQGQEKEAIVMSTVDNEIGEFVDDPKLINVAVSRAERSLTVVMSGKQNDFSTHFGDLVRYIRHQEQLITHSRIRSVFDLLYADYIEARKAFLDKKGRRSQWDSENLAEAVVQEVLQSNEFAFMSLACMRHVPLAWLIGGLPSMTERERRFATHPWAHVDLLIYDTLGKQPLVGIEVDGWAFHRPGSLQHERDETKNAVFRRANLSLIRLSTVGSGEAASVRKALQEAVAAK